MIDVYFGKIGIMLWDIFPSVSSIIASSCNHKQKLSKMVAFYSLKAENAEYLENNYASWYTCWEMVVKMYIIFKIWDSSGR